MTDQERPNPPAEKTSDARTEDLPIESAPDAPTRLGRLRAKSEAVAEPLVGTVRGGVSSAFGSAVTGLRELELPGARVRRVRRLGSQPLASLADLHPDVSRAHPLEVGVRSISVDDIYGTAVGGGDQRGGDFLPLKAFRGKNWAARWQRLRSAQDRLASLPPIDVVKYDGAYWVTDGHNRVALAKYAGQQDIDASVVELILPGAHRTEPIGSLAAIVEASRPARARVDSEEP